MSNTHVVRLDDQELKTELNRLAGCERQSTAALVAHLAEFDARRLYEGEGFSSLFKYCTTVLRLSEGAAYNRIETARVAHRYPSIIGRLAAGTLSVTTVRMLAPHLTAENYETLLTAAEGKGKHAVEHLLATWYPQADVAPSVRKLPVHTRNSPPAPPSGMVEVVAADPGQVRPDTACVPAPTLTRPEAAPAVPRHPIVRPLAAERFEIRFTASAETLEKLRTAQDLLGHAVPNGDLAQVFDRALSLLVADLARKKFAATSQPRTRPTAPADKRHIPAAVKRETAFRDRGCCAYVSPSGRRCQERRFLEFHHIVPYAAGGPATLENIQLRCRAHNGHAVDQYFGPGKRRARNYGRREAVGREEVARSGTSPVAHSIRTPIATGG